MEPITFNVEDIFEDIADDPDNVLLKFPPEIVDRMEWKEGDVLNITVQGNAIIVKKHV